MYTPSISTQALGAVNETGGEDPCGTSGVPTYLPTTLERLSGIWIMAGGTTVPQNREHSRPVVRSRGGTRIHEGSTLGLVARKEEMMVVFRTEKTSNPA